jgi:hypothetical protein
MAGTAGPVSATITFNPQNQNLDTIHKVVASIVGRTGCRTCGRLLNLLIQFQGDPGPELSKEGVASVVTQGF